MASEHVPPPDEVAAALAESLAAHPDAGVSAISEDGHFQPLPDSLPRTAHPVLAGESVFDTVSESSVAAVIEGWRRTQAQGIGVAAVHTPDGQPATIHCFDTRATHGVFVMLLIPGEALTSPEVDEEVPLPSRFGTFRRDMLAAVLDADEGARGLLGWELAEVTEIAPIDLIHPEDQPNANANWLDMLTKPGVPQRYRGRFLRKSYTYVWLEITNTNRLEDPAHGDVLSEMMDITEEMATAEALREREELLHRLTDALPLGVLQISRGRQVVYANQQLFEIVGRGPADTLDEQLQAVLADDRHRLSDAVDAVLRTGERAALEVHLRLAGASEDRICHLAMRALRDARDDVTGAVVCVSDITESTAMRQELEVRATFDLLTRCYNRASAMAALDRLLAQARPDWGVGVIFVDLDRFKPINDELGHAAGDALLITVADRLRAVVRGDDLVCRLGGDEFVVVCPGVTRRDTVVEIARRIGAEVAEPVVLAGHPLAVTSSVGVACSLDGYATPDALVAAADAAMYSAKAGARRADGTDRTGEVTAARARVLGTFPAVAPAAPVAPAD